MSWNNLILIVVICGSLFSCLSDKAVAETSAMHKLPIFSSATRAADKAILDVKVPACYSIGHYRLEYVSSPSPQVTVFVSWYKDKVTQAKYEGGPLRLLGTVTLTPAQRNRLDERLRQIRLYRSIEDKGVSTATFALIRNGEKVYSEDFVKFPLSIELLEDSWGEDVKAIPFSPYKHLWFSGTKPVLCLSQLEDIAETSGKQKKPLPYLDLKREETMAWRSNHLEEMAAKARAKLIREMQGMLKDLPGRNSVEKFFTVNKVYRASYSTYGDTITAEMKASGRVIDDVTWYNRIVNGKPTRDWHAVLETVNEIENRVQRIPWLVAWKATSPAHTIKTVVVESKPDDSEEDDQIRRAWQHARLSGAPEYKLILERGDGGWITVFGNHREDRLLVTYAYPAKNINSQFWWNSLSLDYRPVQKTPQFAVINPDGTGQKNTRSDAKWATRYARENNRSVEE